MMSRVVHVRGSTVTRDYDRTFGVEIIDSESNATETLHYTLRSNTVTIKAGETRADVMVHGIYDNIGPADSLGFTLSLVMPESLVMPGMGRKARVVLMKSCPFEIEGFTGWCVLSSTFLQPTTPPVSPEACPHREASAEGQHDHLPELDEKATMSKSSSAPKTRCPLWSPSLRIR